MPPPRLLPWVPLLAIGQLAACEPLRPRAAEPTNTLRQVPPVTSAPAVAAAPLTDGGALALAPERILTDAELAEDVRDANGATLALYSRATRSGENAMISGASVRHSVGAAYYGAVGVTAREMAGALMLDDDRDLAASLARAELAAWQDARGKAELDIATRLWVDKGFSIRQDFEDKARSAFGAPAETIAYDEPEKARALINEWVSGKTHGKIPELLPSGSIDPNTSLLITNAIWWKGRWLLPFPKSATKEEAFKVDPKRTVKTPMMHLSDTFGFAASGGVKLLELRYAESEMAMLIALPDDPAGLAKLESRLTAGTLDTWTAALAAARVDVALPRFSFRSGAALKTALEQLGMKRAFTTEADFSDIARSDSRKLFISDVVHQTYIAVDEIGTEAAAATGTVFRTTSSILGPTVEFRADHPFFFVLRDTKRGRVLFAGRVVDPSP